MENSAIFMQKIEQICEEYKYFLPHDATHDMSVEELCTIFLKNLNGNGSSRAFANKVHISKFITAKLGKYMLRELNIDILSQFVNGLSLMTYTRGGTQSAYSQTHIDKIYMLLNSILDSAIDKKLILENPLKNISRPISRKYSEVVDEALTDLEISAIIQAFADKPMWKLIVILLAYTGMRPGEVYALRFSDFNYSECSVKVRRTLSLDVTMDIENKTTIESKAVIKVLKNERNGIKEYARRVLSVSQYVISCVREYEKNQQIKSPTQFEDYIFTAPSDGLLKRPDYYSSEYHKQLERHGLNPAIYNPYRFRHTFCTRLFKLQKLDPKTVQLMMGDNNLDMVMRVYNQVNKDDIIRESAEFARQMDSSLKYDAL